MESSKGNDIPAVATAGSFDGVHLGHQAVLKELTDVARVEAMRPLAITFDRHPLEIVAPSRAPHLLLSHDRQEQLIRRSGADFLRLPFDASTARMSAREWLRLLRERYGVKALVVGYDNTFGHDGIDMSIADYERLGEEEGILVKEAPLVAGVSSSAIRRAVAAGDVEKAREMLGRPYELEGSVIAGEALGRTLGYPTANLSPHPRRLVPANGVYAASALTPDGKEYPAMVNIGRRPTVDDSGRRSIEAHIIGWEGDLYCRPLSIHFLSRIRDEKKFNSVEALRTRLHEDALISKKIFDDFRIEQPEQTL